MVRLSSFIGEFNRGFLVSSKMCRAYLNMANYMFAIGAITRLSTYFIRLLG